MTADIGVNAYQRVAGSAGSYQAFAQGNYVGGVLGAVGGLLGFVGAAYGARGLRFAMLNDPTMNPSNYTYGLRAQGIYGGLLPVPGVTANFVGAKGWRVSVFGRPQVTSPGHAQKIFNMATEMANSGSYSSVYMHSKWSKILNGTNVVVSPNRLPDIAGIRLDGTIDVIEIASKTDDLTMLLDRNLAIWNQLPDNLRGDIIVIDQLGNWRKVFP